MYCIQCGVLLADSQQRCPLCGTAVGTVPQQPPRLPPYPPRQRPEKRPRPSAVNGILLFLFLLPLLLTVFVDLQTDGRLHWSLYAAGALVLAYLVFALPLWLHRPEAAVLLPCDFAACALYLLLVEQLSGGQWFLPFALPLTLCSGLLVTALTVLLRFLHGGRLYVLGGFFMGLALLMLLTEFLLLRCFSLPFLGWSVYPFTVLLLLGGLLIFLALNRRARAGMERRFFF